MRLIKPSLIGFGDARATAAVMHHAAYPPAYCAVGWKELDGVGWNSWEQLILSFFYDIMAIVY